MFSCGRHASTCGRPASARRVRRDSAPSRRGLPDGPPAGPRWHGLPAGSTARCLLTGPRWHGLPAGSTGRALAGPRWHGLPAGSTGRCLPAGPPGRASRQGPQWGGSRRGHGRLRALTALHARSRAHVQDVATGRARGPIDEDLLVASGDERVALNRHPNPRARTRVGVTLAGTRAALHRSSGNRWPPGQWCGGVRERSDPDSSRQRSRPPPTLEIRWGRSPSRRGFIYRELSRQVYAQGHRAPHPSESPRRVGYAPQTAVGRSRWNRPR